MNGKACRFECEGAHRTYVLEMSSALDLCVHVCAHASMRMYLIHDSYRRNTKSFFGRAFLATVNNPEYSDGACSDGLLSQAWRATVCIHVHSAQ